MTIVPQPPSGASAALSDLLHASHRGERLFYVLLLDTGMQLMRGLPLERHPDPAVDALVWSVVEQWHDEPGQHTDGSLIAGWLREREVRHEP